MCNGLAYKGHQVDLWELAAQAISAVGTPVD